jgi:Tol biopolymer transport system component
MGGRKYTGSGRSVRAAARTPAGVLLTVALLLVAASTPALAAYDDTFLINWPANPGPPANDAVWDGSISADGRMIAFYSAATNLTSDPDTSPEFIDFDVYVRDVGAGTTKLVSRATGALGAPQDGDAGEPSISADGRYVAFESDAGNLGVEQDLFPSRFIFVRDLEQDTTELVSRETGIDGPPGEGFWPSISADGRYVAFDSQADNLSTADLNSVYNVFVRDRQASETVLVSRTSGGGAANGHSNYPSVSGDGRFVAFVSGADNLSTDDNNSMMNVFVRNLQAGQTILVNRADGQGPGANNSTWSAPAISANGRFVAFTSAATNIGANPSGEPQVWVRDLQQNTTTLISRPSGLATPAAGGELSAHGHAGDPIEAISADGRYVSFSSGADNLSVEDNDAYQNAYVRDRRSGRTLFVSRASGSVGPAGDANSWAPIISGDGRFVAFLSAANNLSVEDNDTWLNLFRRELPPPLSDDEALLYRHVPLLDYVYGEGFFADSAAELTDNYLPGADIDDSNKLLRDIADQDEDLLLAASNPSLSNPDLSLDSLVGDFYPFAPELIADDSDWLDARNPNGNDDYGVDAAIMHGWPKYADRVYGHAVRDTNGKLWLQYWLFYYFNSAAVAGFGSHEGDWEMVQIGLDPGYQPDVVVFQQHDGGARCAWEDVKKTVVDGVEVPVVYAALDSHASYPSKGTWATTAQVRMDRTQDDPPEESGHQVRPLLEVVSDTYPEWVDWPGHWGNSRAGGLLATFESNSPLGPAEQTSENWSDPLGFHDDAHGCFDRRLEPTIVPIASPRIDVTRQGDFAVVEWRLVDSPTEPLPAALRLTLDSPTDDLGPAAFAVDVRGTLSGTKTLPIPLRPGNVYHVVARTYSEHGVHASRVVEARVPD